MSEKNRNSLCTIVLCAMICTSILVNFKIYKNLSSKRLEIESINTGKINVLDSTVKEKFLKSLGDESNRIELLSDKIIVSYANYYADSSYVNDCYNYLDDNVLENLEYSIQDKKKEVHNLIIRSTVCSRTSDNEWTVILDYDEDSFPFTAILKYDSDTSKFKDIDREMRYSTRYN